MKKRQLIVLFLFVLHTSITNADNTVVLIDSSHVNFNINNNVFVFNNNACRFDIYQVRNKTFINLNATQNIQSDCLWYKITIHNNTNADTQIVLFTGNNDYVDLYINENLEIFTHYKAGQLNSYSDRSFPTGKDSKFLLNFRASENKTLFIRMHNTREKPIVADFTIQSYKYFVSEHNKKNLINIIFVVLIMVGIFYAIISFFIHKQIISVYYALFLIGELMFLLVYSTIIFEVILVDFLLDSLLYLYILHQFFGLFYTQFSRELITKNRFPFLDKLLQISVLIKLSWCVIQLASYKIFDEIDLLEKLNLTIYLLDGIFAFYIIVKVFDRKDKITNLFILGTFILTFFNILGIISFIASMKISPLLIHELGVIGQLFVLSIGLSLKLRDNLVDEKQKILEMQIQAQDLTKKEISSALHTGLGSDLSATILNLENKIGDTKETQTIRKIYNSIRTASHILALPDFIVSTIEDEINNLVTNFSTDNIEIEAGIFSKTGWENIAPAIQQNIYRIVQELFTNTLKHAQATQIDIQLVRHSNYINLSYEDNGKGYNPHQIITSKGYQNEIIARTKVIKGTFTDDSKINEGAILTFKFPIIK